MNKFTKAILVCSLIFLSSVSNAKIIKCEPYVDNSGIKMKLSNMTMIFHNIKEFSFNRIICHYNRADGERGNYHRIELTTWYGKILASNCPECWRKTNSEYTYCPISINNVEESAERCGGREKRYKENESN